jgi:hypothetical protein
MTSDGITGTIKLENYIFVNEHENKKFKPDNQEMEEKG